MVAQSVIMAQPGVNCDPFHLVAIYFIGDKGGTVEMSALGLDNNVKTQFASLNLPKKQKIGNVLDKRPDLFERTMGKSGGPAIKLTEAAMKVLQTNELPAPGPEVQKALAVVKPQPVASGSGGSGFRNYGIEMPELPANIMDPTAARKYFIGTVCRVIGVTQALQLTTNEMGGIKEIKDAWTAGTLNNNYKMVDIMRERPDLLQVKKGPDIREVWVSLTNMGQAYSMPGCGVVPDPDYSCPKPFEPKLPHLRKYTATHGGSSFGSSFSASRTTSVVPFDSSRDRSRSPYGSSSYPTSGYGSSSQATSGYGNPGYSNSGYGQAWASSSGYSRPSWSA